MSERSNELCWYVVHTYSGYENKVKDTLLKSVENSESMQKLIFEVEVPVEEVTEIRNGKRVKVQRKTYPGYVLVHMIETSDSWYVVRNTRGVTGFVGPDSKPIALTDEEVEMMLHPPVKDVVADIAIGDSVTFVNGSFEGMTGTVADLDLTRGKASVQVQIFGQATSTEVDLSDIKRV